ASELRRRSPPGRLPPPLRHRRQAGRAANGGRLRSVSEAIDKCQLCVESDVQTRRDLEPRVFEHVRAAAAAPSHDRLVTSPQQGRYLRTKEPDHRGDPSVEHLGGLRTGNNEPFEHLNYVFGTIPTFSGDPTVSCKKTNRLALSIDGDRDQVADFVPRPAFEGCGLRRQRQGDIGGRPLGGGQRADAAGPPPGPEKGMENAGITALPARPRTGREEHMRLAFP